jgi:hypothetical protein
VEEIEQLQGMVNSFYQKLFSNNHVGRDWFQTTITFPMLESDNIEKLSEPFRHDEVKHALFSMNLWKAPGPDGFSVGFYQKDWETVAGLFVNLCVVHGRTLVSLPLLIK